MKWTEAQDQHARERRLTLNVRISIQTLKRLFRKLKNKFRREKNDSLEQP